MTACFLFFILGAAEIQTFTPFPSGVSFQESDEVFNAEFNREEGFLSSEPGAPLLPLSCRVFILPGACTISDASVQLFFSGNRTRRGVLPAAAEPLQPTGSGHSAQAEPSRIEITGDEPLVSFHTGTILGKVTVVSFSINPWVYRPDKEEVTLAASCRLSFNWHSTPGIPSLSHIQAETVNHRVSSIAGEFSVPAPPSVYGQGSDTDYLLITGGEYTALLEPLKEYLETESYTVDMLAVDEIAGAWSGTDVQEDIRNCIRHYAMNQGTAYVLLAGDEEVVPHRDVYMECENHVEMAPCDLYYADLDGSWDGNGNGIYGEWEDSLDLYADVILGRLLFSTPLEAETIVSKNLEYAQAPDAGWYRQAVLCGALLFPEIGYTGERGCEMMAEEYPNDFTLVKAYQTLSGDYPDTYFPVLYSGAGWNHYAGHGNDRGVYWAGNNPPMISVSRMYGFDNPGRYGIHSSIACHTGDFTDPGVNLPDTLLSLSNGGGIACLFNTTWGWEGYWPEIGSSERLCINTVQQVYRQHASTLGLAYTTAKDLEIPMITGPYDRVMQSVLAYSAFSEPSLAVLGVHSFNPVPPLPFRIVPQGPNPVTGGETAFRVTGAYGSYAVSVHDISGRQVMDSFSVQRSTLHYLQLEDLPSGVYFLRAASPGGAGTSSSFVKL